MWLVFFTHLNNYHMNFHGLSIPEILCVAIFFLMIFIPVKVVVKRFFNKEKLKETYLSEEDNDEFTSGENGEDIRSENKKKCDNIGSTSHGPDKASKP